MSPVLHQPSHPAGLLPASLLLLLLLLPPSPPLQRCLPDGGTCAVEHAADLAATPTRVPVVPLLSAWCVNGANVWLQQPAPQHLCTCPATHGSMLQAVGHGLACTGCGHTTNCMQKVGCVYAPGRSAFPKAALDLQRRLRRPACQAQPKEWRWRRPHPCSAAAPRPPCSTTDSLVKCL
jgi:hypothetical protein